MEAATDMEFCRSVSVEAQKSSSVLEALQQCIEYLDFFVWCPLIESLLSNQTCLVH